MQVLSFDALVNKPWKNGGGITRDIARGLHLSQTIWTLSRADVSQDGPFSDFSGMTRILTVVSGGTMTLTSPSGIIQANFWQPVRFDGALAVHSHLKDGPLTNLNLMFDPQFCTGDVVLRKGSLTYQTSRPEYGLIALHTLAGEPIVEGTALCAGDTAFITDKNAALSLSNGDVLLEIRLTYLDQRSAIKLCIAER
ncbi:MAG: HutD family protein [Roseobacter sp.]